MTIENIRLALTLLHNPDDVIEIRIPKTGFNGKQVYAGYFNDIEKCLSYVKKYDSKVPAIYTNLNPINPALMARANNRVDEKASATTQDSDVIKRTRLLIDIDPIRPAGISSTNDEHIKAIKKADHITNELNNMGWGKPVFGDSGNGASLIYPIDMENTPESLEIIKNVLKTLDYLFSDSEVNIDQSVCNAARIVKLYGTTAKKGDSTEERPHRESSIIEYPKESKPVSIELMKELINRLPTEPKEPHTKTSSNFDIMSWLEKYNISISSSRAWNGGTVLSLNECCFDSNHKSPDASIIIHKSGAISYHCFHNSCKNHTWQELRGMKEGRTISTQSSPKFNPQQANNDEALYTDMRNSKKLAEKIRNKAKYNTSSKCWMGYNGKVWEHDKNGLMLRYAREIVRDLQEEALLINNLEKRKEALGNALRCESLSRLKSMVELCQSEEDMCIDENGFDINPMLLNVQNGTLDLKTGVLLPHNPLDFMTKISPVHYDPSAKCERFIQFLYEALLINNEDMPMSDRLNHTKNIIDYAQRHAGYCLTGSTKEEQFLILLGDGGNGKSKYIGSIGYVLGDYYGKIDIATIQESARGKDGSAPTPDIVKMKGLRLISTSEPEKGLRLNESRIKDFTGRDPITCRALHSEPITYPPEYKLTVYTNYPIIIRGQDKSMWRRLHQMRFDNEPKCVDKDLDLKLQSEGSGILNWMLQGCLEWNKRGLDTPAEIIEIVNEYKDDMDILSGYFELCCECDKKDKNLKEQAKVLFHVYQAWWEVDNNTKAPYFDKQFYHALEERGFKRAEKYSRTGLLIKGVKLASPICEAYERAKTTWGGWNCEAVKEVKEFLANFVNIAHVEKKPEKCFTFLTPSHNEPMRNDSQNNMQAKPSNLTNLTELILKAGENKIINSSNIVEFSIKFVEMYKPQWKNNNETGFYTPSAIKGIASKIFGITPGV